MKRILLTGVILLLTIAMTANGKDRNIVYQDNHVRFTVISDGVIRLEYSSKGDFVDDKSFIAVNRLYDKVLCHVKKNSWIEIITSKMCLCYKKNSGIFTANNLFISSRKGVNPGFKWYPGMEQKENLKGTFRTLDGMKGDTETFDWLCDVKQGHKIPIENGLLATDGWTLIDDSKGLLFDNSDWNWVKQRDNSEAIDWYFMAYGHNYKMALNDYTKFAGKMPLPPRYAFGYWWSRNWAYSDHELREMVQSFKQYEIPLDVLVVDMAWHYTEKGRGGWTGWTWDRRLFPNPKGFLEQMKQDGLKVTLNLHPCDGIRHFETNYDNMATDLGLDPSEKKDIPWVASDKKMMQSFFKNIIHPMEDEGVNFWWPDWQQWPRDKVISQLDNTWWINYIFFTDMQRRRDSRPILLHRWGGLGNHRYQIGFSGDAVVSWETLGFEPYFNSTASNVLYGYWSHDLGGFIGDKVEPELYARWLQFGAYSAIMRTHSVNEPKLTKEPWGFSKQYLDIIKNTIQQRYALAPYIYTMARKGYDEGISLCRPMYYDCPEEPLAYEFRNEYMYGDNLLIAPVTKPAKNGYSTVKVWLPKGQWWEWQTGTMLDGDRIVERRFAIDEFPVYVKAGAIIPMYADKVLNLNANDEAIAVTVFPGKSDNQALFYEDNGNDKNYISAFAETLLQNKRKGHEQIITIGARKGCYLNMPNMRRYKVKLLASCVPINVMINEQKVNWNYDGNEMALIIDVPEQDCRKEKVIKIFYPNNNTDIADGLLAKAKRITKAMELLKTKQTGLVFNDDFGPMGSLAEAVEYAPERMQEFLDTFRKNYQRLPEILDETGVKEELKTWFLKEIDYE